MALNSSNILLQGKLCPLGHSRLEGPAAMGGFVKRVAQIADVFNHGQGDNYAGVYSPDPLGVFSDYRCTELSAKAIAWGVLMNSYIIPVMLRSVGFFDYHRRALGDRMVDASVLVDTVTARTKDKTESPYAPSGLSTLGAITAQFIADEKNLLWDNNSGRDTVKALCAVIDGNIPCTGIQCRAVSERAVAKTGQSLRRWWITPSWIVMAVKALYSGQVGILALEQDRVRESLTTAKALLSQSYWNSWTPSVAERTNLGTMVDPLLARLDSATVVAQAQAEALAGMSLAAQTSGLVASSGVYPKVNTSDKRNAILAGLIGSTTLFGWAMQRRRQAR